MKKTYIKPEIIIENFTLSSQIANCGDIIQFSEDSCENIVRQGGTIDILFNDDDVSNLFTGNQCATDYYNVVGDNEKSCYNGLSSPFNS